MPNVIVSLTADEYNQLYDHYVKFSGRAQAASTELFGGDPRLSVDHALMDRFALLGSFVRLCVLHGAESVARRPLSDLIDLAGVRLRGAPGTKSLSDEGHRLLRDYADPGGEIKKRRARRS